MISWFLVGFLLGMCGAVLFCSWSFNTELEYKARSGIDMCKKGKFYTIKRNYRREQSNGGIKN